MWSINSLKVLVATIGMVLVSVLMISHVITSTEGMPIITMVIGYAVGNGIAAKSGVPVEPFVKKNDA